MITFDTSLLVGFYQSRSGGTAGTVSPAGKKVPVPTPPWDPKAESTPVSDLMKRALLGARFINPDAAKLDVADASQDYGKLFSLYQALDTLHSIAARADAKTLGIGELARLQKHFARGLEEVAEYADRVELEKVRIATGEVAERLRGKSGVRRDDANYVTGAIHSGASTEAVDAFAGDVKFNIQVKRLGVVHDVAIDLSEMGAQTRSLLNVTNFINQKLDGLDLRTRFAAEKLPNEPRTVQVGGKTVTLPAIEDKWALKIKGDTAEQVTFSAQATAPAIYVAQSAGKLPSVQEAKDGQVDETQRQILKFATADAAVPAPLQPIDQPNWVPARAFAEVLPKEVAAVRSTVTGADGSLYVLADLTGKFDGQEIQGRRDVALLKYDSAGNLQFTRTLGAADEASGYALSVAADGRVAIAGSVAGHIESVQAGPLNSSDKSGDTDSFVTLFNADGEELWTVRRGAREDDEAQAVAFGEDGVVYVAGRTRSALSGGQLGGWDSYLTAYGTQASGQPAHLFTSQFGSGADDRVAAMAVDGDRIVIAGAEGSNAMLREFNVARTTSSAGTTTYTTAATAAAGASRDLGDLKGGAIAGLAIDGASIVVAGSTGNGALNVTGITSAHSGGRDAFAARIAGDLSASAGDRLAYFGGTGDDSATALTVSGGQIYIAGSTTSDSGLYGAKIGAIDGYVARVDVAAGAVDWSSRYSARDGVAAPTAIAVDASGASVLDRLGLPKGALDYKDSQLLTANTSLRAGDQFYIRAREGARPTAITIAVGETMQSLAAKVRRAAGFGAKVEVVREGDYSTLQIKPANDRSTVEVIAGTAGKDALAALGLPEGVARRAGGEVEQDKKIYGLKLSTDLSLDGKEAIKAAIEQLAAALSKVRTIYRDLKTAANPLNAGPDAGKRGGTVPAYLQNQLANYQAGLDRLGVVT